MGASVSADVEIDDNVSGRTFVVRGNPFLRAMLIIAVLVTAGGLWAKWVSVVAFYGNVVSPGPFNLEDRVLPHLLGSIAPLLTMFGLCAVVAILTAYAVTWRPLR